MNIKINERNYNSNKEKINLKKEEKTIENKEIKKEKRITYFKLIINSIISLLLIIFIIFIPIFYESRWKMVFFMTIWSFAMNSFYIVSVTIIDWIHFIKKDNSLCFCYNNFVRNLYIKICFPFSISIVFLYWLLILLGDDFEYRGRDVIDTANGLFFHGMILIFLLFDMFTAIHINRINYFWDILIISILIGVYFIILGVGKYAGDYEPYDFMEMSSVRQIIGAAILIYISVLDGYVVFNLLANKFFKMP